MKFVTAVIIGTRHLEDTQFTIFLFLLYQLTNSLYVASSSKCVGILGLLVADKIGGGSDGFPKLFDETKKKFEMKKRIFSNFELIRWLLLRLAMGASHTSLDMQGH